jgi:hypothetical protein
MFNNEPSVSIKQGVRLRGVSPVMAIAHSVVVSVYFDLGIPCRITSVTDGNHMVNSFHNCGEAMDYGIQGLSKEEAKHLESLVQRALGNSFDVVLESTHLHVEHDYR